jgi:hypothetical protein
MTAKECARGTNSNVDRLPFAVKYHIYLSIDAGMTPIGWLYPEPARPLKPLLFGQSCYHVVFISIIIGGFVPPEMTFVGINA